MSFCPPCLTPQPGPGQFLRKASTNLFQCNEWSCPVASVTEADWFSSPLQAWQLQTLWWICGNWPIRPLQRSSPKPLSCPAFSPCAPVLPSSPPGLSGPRSGVREALMACRRNSRFWWPRTMWLRYHKSAALGFWGFSFSQKTQTALSCCFFFSLSFSSSSCSGRWRKPSRVV